MIKIAYIEQLPQPTAPVNRVERFEEFYRLFKEVPEVFKYELLINDVFAKGGDTLIIDYEDLLVYDAVIAEMLRNDPESLLEDALEAFKNTLIYTKGKIKHQEYFIRIASKREKSVLTKSLRDILAEDIEKLIWIEGIITRRSKKLDKLIIGSFECMVCGATFTIQQLTLKVKWPNFCTNNRCKAKAQTDFRLIPKDSEFIDWQIITIQEFPESLPPGEIPISHTCFLSHDLVDNVKPGDRVKLMAYKKVIMGPIQSHKSNLIKPTLQVIFIESESKRSPTTDITKEDLKQIKTLSEDKEVQNKIIACIAPSIYGRKNLKMASALSLFGGTKRKRLSGGHKRGDIHILFVGDPGTAKSVILKSVIEIAPRGIYTSGKGSSAVGLTAAVVRDEETGQYTIEAGALLLANGGIAAIDEFDKMEKKDRSAIHESMEQQTVSISKAGIVATLKTETTIIAAANPHSGRYDRYKTPTQNIRLPPSLVSRFDLIFVVIDKPDKAEDAQIAEFILQQSMEETLQKNQIAEIPIEQELLKKYVRYAKTICSPSLSEEAKEAIKEFYLKLRSEYDSEDAIVSILARNLDGLVRLSEAYAKMALRKTVLRSDVEAILPLYKEFLHDIGYDETTGKVDLDRVFVGESRSKLNKLDKLMSRLKVLFEENNWKELERKGVIQILELEDLDRKFIENALDAMIKDATLYEPKTNYIKLSKRDD